MFSFIKEKLKKIYNSVTDKLHVIFLNKKIDATTLEELRLLLIKADTGIITTKKILNNLEEAYKKGKINDGESLHCKLKETLIGILNIEYSFENKSIFMLVGINGSGKTTAAGKLAHYFSTTKNNKVLIIAADTFRAAAVAQLEEWGKKSNCTVFVGAENQDPAAVVFGGLTRFIEGKFDKLIIDTAGRLQNKENLMRELEKIKRVLLKKIVDESQLSILLTVDAMLGQNSFDQAAIFNESIKLDGLILTKIDGTGKGGIIFSITEKLNVPVAFISYGEQLSDIKKFDASDYINELLG